MHDLRITVAVAQVLRAFLEDVTEAHYGYELMRLTGFPSGKLYPILARLQAAGWLVRETEDIDPRLEGRPARTMYKLSVEAVPAARQELATIAQHVSPPSSASIRRPRPEGRLA